MACGLEPTQNILVLYIDAESFFSLSKALKLSKAVNPYNLSAADLYNFSSLRPNYTAALKMLRSLRLSSVTL